MPRHPILNTSLAAATIIIVASLLYTWRWRVCYRELELTLANEVVTDVFGEEGATADQHGMPNEQQVARWIDDLTLRYPERSDSWAGVEEAGRDAKYRIWSAPPEPRIFESRERQRFCSHTLDLRYPRKSLHAECRSEDEQFEILCTLSDIPGIRRLTFRDRQNDVKGSLEFYQIGYWLRLVEIDGVYYQLFARVNDFPQEQSNASERAPHELDWAKHSYRFQDEETFLKTSLETIDTLEQQIRTLLQSNDPSLSGYRATPVVNIITCTCEPTYPKAHKPLTEEQRASILKDATTELQRRRDVLKNHSELWFEMLEKVLVN